MCVRGHVRLRLTCRCSLRGKVVHDLDLERLIELHERSARLIEWILIKFEDMVGFDALRHFRLDCRKVFWGERAFKKEVVVEAVSDCGADPKLGPWEEAHHRLGHHVSSRVTHAAEVVGSTSV